MVIIPQVAAKLLFMKRLIKGDIAFEMILSVTVTKCMLVTFPIL